MLWIITAIFGFFVFLFFLVSEVPPPPSQASSFEEKEVTFVTNFSSKTKESYEKTSYEKTVAPFFSEEEYEELYALQDSFEDRPIRPKPYGKTYGVEYLSVFTFDGVEMDRSDWANLLEEANKLETLQKFAYREVKVEKKKETKPRKNNWKKSLRDHRR